MTSRARAAAQADLGRALQRVADEEMATSGGRGAGASLSAAEVEQAVAAAVERVLARARPDPEAGDPPAVARASAELTAALTELRGMINQVASPAQGRSAAVKKTKRFELGQSTCREKARPCSASAVRRGPSLVPRAAQPSFRPTPQRRAGPTRRAQVTQGVYSLLLRSGLHYKPTEEEVVQILTTATSNDASQADVDLSKENIHACVRVLSCTRACLLELSTCHTPGGQGL
jgi:hypothetical protein